MIADLQGKIRNNWEPPSALGAGIFQKRTVKIRLTLLKDGTIEDPEIEESSGSRVVDDSVIKAITTLKQRITPPSEDLEFIVDFNLF